jgi:hypothetical protein
MNPVSGASCSGCNSHQCRASDRSTLSNTATIPFQRLIHLSELQHDNWAKVHHVSRHGHVVVAVGEERPWCLEGYCHAEAPGLDERMRIMRQCAAGLDYLHGLPEVTCSVCCKGKGVYSVHIQIHVRSTVPGP